jgi:autotransporter-associated beta strand protein
VTIGTPITDADDTQVLQKVGSGLLVVSADNSAANGGIQITGGTMQFESPSSINGSGLKVTVNAGGTMVFGPTFGSANIPTALLERVVDGSAGTIAADNYSSTDFDFATAFKSAAFLGAVGNLSYTGTVTPNGSTYRLGGGGGTLTMAEPNALTGVGASAVVRGNVTLAAANDLDGGITLNSGWLQLGNDASLGGGPLATNGGRVSSADTTARTLANALDVNANLALGDATNNGTLTFTGGVDISGATRTFTTNSDVEFAGIVSGGNALTKAGAATLTLSGDNTYTGTTTVDGGILVFSGSNNSAGATTLNGATLQLDSDSNGGLASGLLTISQNAGVLQAINEDRVIANNVSLNSSPTISGSQSLTINGTLTLNNNRILTNSITGTGKLLTIAAISRDGTNNRNLTVSGDGDTTVTGGVTLGTGTLTKNGAGTLTLQGANSYTGATTVNTGGTLALVGGSQDSPITVNSGAFLGFTLDSPTTSTKALNLNTGHAIRITGTPTLASYTLITAASIGGTGTPTLAAPIAGYELVVDGTSLKLNIGGGSAYDTWKAQITNGQDLRTDDAEGDGFTNLQEFLFGTSPIAGSGSLVTTTASGGNLVLRWLQLETGATYTLKQSSTLVAGSWTTAAQSPAIDANQTGAPTGYDYYSVSIPTGGGRMFFRIEGVEN